MKLRFVVGVPGVSQSKSWKLETQGNEVYMLSRDSGSIHKFSFHSSGICRWAALQERGDGRDRAMLKWKRGTIPGTGRRQGALLLSIMFPTNHLSACTDSFTKSIRWIEPAPQGQATNIEAFLTSESRAVVADAFAGRNECELLAFGTLRDGTHVGVAKSYVDCGPVELRSPGNPALPGSVFGDLVFPEHDTLDTGRPVRLLMMTQPQNERGLQPPGSSAAMKPHHGRDHGVSLTMVLPVPNARSSGPQFGEHPRLDRGSADFDYDEASA